MVGHITGNGKSNPFKTARLGGNEGVDADYLVVERQQRSAAVARVDGGIGLQKILIAAWVRDTRSMFGTDNPLGNGLVESPGLTDGYHPLTDDGFVRIGKF